MSRLLVFVYGLICYVVGFAGLVWFILYIGGWGFLPKHIDSEPAGPLGAALITNLGLMLSFGLHHSIAARPVFKQKLTKIIPVAAERSTYVLLSGLLLAAICLYWQPINGFLWQVENPIGRGILITGYYIGWFICVFASFLINHFELFGLQQIYFNLREKPEPSSVFRENSLYKIVRHPLQLGIFIGIWSTPTMSMTHLMLSILMTTYMFIGLHYEEKDLINALGQKYEEYRQRVRMILPIPK